MASGSPCSGGSGPLPRGLISCSHCRPHDAPTVRLPDHDFRHAVQKLIDGFYEEAFDRLPRKSDAMPDLLRLLTTGGSCLGLLDPVSNIILNTLALLPYPAASVANLSCISLVHFLVAYFGCLTSQQAFRYLYFAGADLPLAVMLVQHDLYQQPHALDPDSARTQAALKSAATKANHPEPNTLVQLMAIRLYTDDHRFALLKKKFAGDRTASLSSKNVRAIHHLLHRPYDEGGMLPRIPVVERTTTSVDVSSDGSTITTTTTTVRRVSHRITSLRHIDDMAAKLASCLPKAAYGNTDLEPKYTLDFVVGVEESRRGPHPHMARMCYHVNFMATCGLRLQKTLFFAEFWSFGRCYYGVHKTRRIVYPDRSEYILPDISSGKVDSMLEMDLVYFSSQRVARETLTKPVKKKNRR
ncbi:unnamed protein product [Alopecurus aequalis]